MAICSPMIHAHLFTSMKLIGEKIDMNLNGEQMGMNLIGE
jgi:hypothetical protein